MKMMQTLQTWLLITVMALSANTQVSAKVASGGINLSPELHQSLDESKSLNALGISGVSTIDASGSPLVPNGGTDFIRFKSDYDTHIVFRDLNVPRKRGIGGAHNKDEFFKNTKDFKIESRVPHPTVDGIETITYRMSSLDRAGNPTVAYSTSSWLPKKTIYDPSKISRLSR